MSNLSHVIKITKIFPAQNLGKNKHLRKEIL